MQIIDLSGRVQLLVLSESSQSGWSRSYDCAVTFYALRRLFLRPPNEQEPWAWFPTPPGPKRRPSHVLATNPSSNGSGIRYSLASSEASSQGRRRQMEDVTIIDLKLGLVCLFDGHGGRGCATWASERMPRTIMQELRRTNEPREALWRAIVDVDRVWALEQGKRVTQDTSGCTAIVVLFDLERSVYVANLGDCRCVLARADSTSGGRLTAHELSFDARADRSDEIARICASQGFVANRRVNGQLAVSRAIGDVAYKRYAPDGFNAGPVSAQPDITEILVDPKDEFIVVACDGLWDVLSSQAVVDFVRASIRAHEQAGNLDLKVVCRELVRHAVDDKMSTDNVSVCITRFVIGSPRPLHSQPYQRDDTTPCALRLPYTFPANPGALAIRTATTSVTPTDYSRKSHGFASPQPGLFSHPKRHTTAITQHKSSSLQRVTQLPSSHQFESRRSLAAKSTLLVDNDDDLLEFLLDDRNFLRT